MRELIEKGLDDLEDAYLGAAALETHRRSDEAAIPLTAFDERPWLGGLRSPPQLPGNFASWTGRWRGASGQGADRQSGGALALPSWRPQSDLSVAGRSIIGAGGADRSLQRGIPLM